MEITQERRNLNADDARTKAAKKLAETDFSRWMGSGFNIKITDLEGRLLTPEFGIRGEDMANVAPPIIESLKESLAMKRQLLLSELKDIEGVIGS